MSKHYDLILGLGLSGATVALTFYSVVVAALTGTLALGVWSLKMRTAWRHRND